VTDGTRLTASMTSFSRAVAAGPGFGILLAAAVLAGCGGAVTSKPSARAALAGTSRPTTTNHTPETGSDSSGGGSGSMIFLGGGEISGSAQPTPPRDLYAVFRRASNGEDLLVRETARDDSFADSFGNDPTESALGEPMYGETRLVSGTPGNGLYAYPTTKDAVCVGHMPNGGGACGDPGPHALTVGYDEPADGEPFVAYGLVGDDVRSIDLVIDGITHHAEVRENGYMLKVPVSQGAEIEHLILHLSDGTKDDLG
jgi:hypothetical protein